MITLSVKKEIKINQVEEPHIIDAVMRFSFLAGYVTKSYKEGESSVTLKAGTVMSLNPNDLRHDLKVSFKGEGTLVIEACKKAFPWARTKEREILSYRIAQLIKTLYGEGIIAGENLSEEEKGVTISRAPFTHSPGTNILYIFTGLFYQALCGALAIVGVIGWMWLYGIFIIDVTDSRLFLEVLAGTISKADLIGGGSVIGIAIGSVVGTLLSVYFVLSEHISFLNRRILSFAIFYSLIMCFFIIEEEAFIVSSVLALAVPFMAYTFYYLVWGLKKVYIKGD